MTKRVAFIGPLAQENSVISPAEQEPHAVIVVKKLAYGPPTNTSNVGEVLNRRGVETTAMALKRSR